MQNNKTYKYKIRIQIYVVQTFFGILKQKCFYKINKLTFNAIDKYNE